MRDVRKTENMEDGSTVTNERFGQSYRRDKRDRRVTGRKNDVNIDIAIYHKFILQKHRPYY